MQEPENTSLILNPTEPEQTNLTPDKARSLLEMFSRQIRNYATQSLDMFRPTPRIVTAQRPFYERYQYKPHNGNAEMARRREQIAKGQLTLSNGLVGEWPGGGFIACDSHGKYSPWPKSFS